MSNPRTSKQTVYISGALTNTKRAEELKGFYEALAALCSKLGLEPYVPHLVTDPSMHPNVAPRDVFDTDKNQILRSALVLAYVGEPSLGVGMEIAYAETASVPVIILYEKGKIVSRLVRGTPTIAGEIVYSTKTNALVKLHKLITALDWGFDKNSMLLATEGMPTRVVKQRLN